MARIRLRHLISAVLLIAAAAWLMVTGQSPGPDAVLEHAGAAAGEVTGAMGGSSGAGAGRGSPGGPEGEGAEGEPTVASVGPVRDHNVPVDSGSPANAPVVRRDIPRGPVPPHFFGMHLIKVWLPGVAWPAAPVGLYRAVDATPRWHDLSPGPGRWADNVQEGTGLSRIEAVLLFRDRHGPGTPVMYTLGGGGERVGGRWQGGWPTWFTASTDTMGEWRRFVREVGTRFGGRIRYWEIWNEPDCVCFYVGTVQQLVELTRIASEELRAIDPSHRIVGPAFTDQGLAMMDAFYAAGGGRWVDVVAWHQYNRFPPEADTVRIRAARAIMQKHGIADKPLWTTEGHAVAHPSASDAAILARTYLTLWLYGVSSFAWYAWDIAQYTPLEGHPPTDWVTLTDTSNRIRPAGVAYRELQDWLVGARATSFEIRGDAWLVGTDRGWIVWAAGRDAAPWPVPAAVARMRRLDGSSAPVTGATYTPQPEPVFFQF
jgi:hypothetical protein